MEKRFGLESGSAIIAGWRLAARCVGLMLKLFIGFKAVGRLSLRSGFWLGVSVFLGCVLICILSPKQAAGLERQRWVGLSGEDFAGCKRSEGFHGPVFANVQDGPCSHALPEFDEGWDVSAGVVQRGPEIWGAGLVVERPQPA